MKLAARLFLLCMAVLMGALLVLHPADAAHKKAGASMVARPAPAQGVEDTVPSSEPAGHGHGEGEGKSGLPQMDTSTYHSQLFWLFASFFTLYVLMLKLGLPRVAEVLEMRKSHRESDLKHAQEMQEEASRVKTGYEAALAKAQGEAQSALNEAEQEIAGKMAAENAKFTEAARKRVAAAEQNIAKAKAEAMSSLAEISAEIAMEMTGKVAAVQVGKAEAKKAVTSVMQKEAA